MSNTDSAANEIVRMVRIIVTIFIIAVGQRASAQVAIQAVKSTDVLTYDVFPVAGSRWGSPVPEEMRLERKQSGHEVYKAATSFVFDPASFGFTFRIPGEENALRYDLKVNTTKKPGPLTPGSKWENKFSIPARMGAYCQSEARLTYDAKIEPEQTTSILIDGQTSTVKVVTVVQEGWWSHPPCANGQGSAIVKYSPELQVVLSMEWRTSDVFFLGERSVLKEIRRSPVAGIQNRSSLVSNGIPQFHHARTNH